MSGSRWLLQGGNRRLQGQRTRSGGDGSHGDGSWREGDDGHNDCWRRRLSVHVHGIVVCFIRQRFLQSQTQMRQGQGHRATAVRSDSQRARLGRVRRR